MLSIFRKHVKREDNNPIQDDSINTPPHSTLAHIDTPVDEESLKKSIEAKLRGYRPVEREANFSRPHIFN